MNPFSKLHPLAIAGYYMVTLILLIWMGHPVLYALLFVFMFLDFSLNAGAARMLRTLLYSVEAASFCVIINPLLNHRGVTTLFLLGDTRITKEAVFYGLYMALLLVGAVLLFSCFSSVMTAEKVMTLTGKRFPAFSLLFSMILRIIPKAGKDFREMTALHGNRPRVWSALVGKWMEDSVERSMAMKNRKYGSGKRTSFYQKKLTKQDIFVLVCVCAMAVYVCILLHVSPARVQFFPRMRIEMYGIWHWGIWSVYLGIPIGMRGKEELAWLLSKRRITGSIIRSR